MSARDLTGPKKPPGAKIMADGLKLHLNSY
jgi:hypothetical protein